MENKVKHQLKKKLKLLIILIPHQKMHWILGSNYNFIKWK